MFLIFVNSWYTKLSVTTMGELSMIHNLLTSTIGEHKDLNANKFTITLATKNPLFFKKKKFLSITELIWAWSHFCSHERKTFSFFKLIKQTIIKWKPPTAGTVEYDRFSGAASVVANGYAAGGPLWCVTCHRTLVGSEFFFFFDSAVAVKKLAPSLLGCRRPCPTTNLL